jgi:PTS system ascorbate-specific IIA component
MAVGDGRANAPPCTAARRGHERRQGGMMLLAKQLLSLDTIRVRAEAADWQAAVRLGVDLLAAAGTVEDRYYDAIVEATRALGPWYLLAPGIAMPHGRPEQGVKANSFALVTLATPVAFGDPDNDPIDVLIMLAATDAKSMNESLIVDVVTLVSDDDALRAIRAARSHAEMRQLLQSLADQNPEM